MITEREGRMPGYKVLYYLVRYRALVIDKHHFLQPFVPLPQLADIPGEIKGVVRPVIGYDHKTDRLHTSSEIMAFLWYFAPKIQFSVKYGSATFPFASCFYLQYLLSSGILFSMAAAFSGQCPDLGYHRAGLVGIDGNQY